MSVEAIGALAPLPALNPVQTENLFGTAANAAPAAPFENWFAKEVGAVNDKLAGTDLEIKQLATGSQQSLHDVMIHLEEARLSFQLLAQVRNRLLEAYQDVMRMQV